MDDNEKLLEAARAIKAFCYKTRTGTRCLFSVDGICSIEKCGIASDDLAPDAWKIPNSNRWTEADVALAKALQMFGFYKVKRTNGCYPFVEGKNGEKKIVPKNAFASINRDESVQLADIVFEGENNG